MRSRTEMDPWVPFFQVCKPDSTAGYTYGMALVGIRLRGLISGG